MLEWLNHLLANFGYLAIAIGSSFEGEITLLLGTLASREGILEFPGVILAAFLGTLIGDQFCFYLGRHLGQPFIARHRHWRERADYARRLLERYGAGFMVGQRFFYGLRSVIPFVIGTAHVSRLKFLLCNLLGTLIWTIVMGTIALLLGAAINQLLALLDKPSGVATLVVTGLGLFAVVAALFVWRVRLVHRAERD